MLRGKKQSAMGEAEKGITGQDYKRHKETSGSDVAFFLSICGNKAFFFFFITTESEKCETIFWL